MIEFLPRTSLMTAFLAGSLSFVSPCVLPLVPSYLMYITGLSLGQLVDAAKQNQLRKTIVINVLLCITGFSLVFIAFGASASLIGQFLTDHQHLIRKVGGVLIVLFGFYLLGIVKLKFLMSEKRIHSFPKSPCGVCRFVADRGRSLPQAGLPASARCSAPCSCMRVRPTPLQTGSRCWRSIPLAWGSRCLPQRWEWTAFAARYWVMFGG